MAGKILDNGTLVTLGIVGVVAAVGTANKAGLRGSLAQASRILYHASPIANRASIARQGLQMGISASYGPPGVYLFWQDFFAESYHPWSYPEPMDIWEVETKGYRLHDDPEDPHGAAYLERNVPVSRIRRIGTVLDGTQVTVTDAQAAAAPEGYDRPEWAAWLQAFPRKNERARAFWAKWVETLPEVAKNMRATKTGSRSAPTSWRDAPAPYFRVNFGNGQVSDVYHGAEARARAEAYRAALPSRTPYLERYDLDGGEWFPVRK